MHSNGLGQDLLKKRDLANFTQMRTAHPGDDLQVGELLVRSFRETYAKKMPGMVTSEEREIELRDVVTRRRHGVVRVLELGFEIIATYALIAPGQPLDESWTANTCTLRCLAMDPRFHSLQLSERLIVDAIEMAKRWATDGICLHVQAGAEGVARLYQKFGFLRAAVGDSVSFGNSIEAYLLTLPKQESALG